ncbi:MAG: hypothetical protein JW874_16210 [Spirochaetales bacterium]|nr:hypothetical protein [Spirochaetales bacterium]
MQLSQYEFERFSTKAGFNNSLNHFQKVTDILPEFQDYYNLADLLNELISEKEIQQNQLAPIVFALLIDKFSYFCQSVNLPETITNFDKFKKEIASWNAVDLVLAYNHPQLGYTLINPKNEKHWDAIQNFTKNELITIFAGGFDKTIDASLASKAIKAIISLLESNTPGTTIPLKKGPYKFTPLEEEEEEEEELEEYEEDEAEDEEEAAPAAPSGGKKRMTPFYSIPVTNELFHNGNVEAWKKIIQSYQAKNPGLDVFIFYDGERIHDINTLFKWGKVKHGSTILIAVAGDNIRDVAKLQRYLKQGASPKFEDFLRFPVNTVLNLF